MKYTLRYQLKLAAAKLFLVLACVWALVGWMPVSDHRYIEITLIDSHLQEDDPGWDCRTMGNRFCGRDMGVVPL